MKGDSTIARQITTTNPATEEVINTYEIITKEQISEKGKNLRTRFLIGRKTYRKELIIFMMSLRNLERARKSLRG